MVCQRSSQAQEQGAQRGRRSSRGVSGVNHTAGRRRSLEGRNTADRGYHSPWGLQDAPLSVGCLSALHCDQDDEKILDAVTEKLSAVRHVEFSALLGPL